MCTKKKDRAAFLHESSVPPLVVPVISRPLRTRDQERRSTKFG